MFDKKENVMEKIVELFCELVDLWMWNVNVEWVKEGEWFKVRNGVEGDKYYDSVMYDVKKRGGDVVVCGNGYGDDYYLFVKYIKGLSVSEIVSGICWSFN